jgi:serine/threonine protein kinase
MELLGSNLLEYKRAMLSFNVMSVYKIFFSLIDAIEEIHKHDIIHQDIKPSNVVLYNNEVKLIDFGSSRREGDETLCNISSLTYASLNVHYGKVCSKKDDLWSFLFLILDMLNEKLPWKDEKVYINLTKDNIICVKEKFINSPSTYLSKNMNRPEILDMITHLKEQEVVDYDYLRNLLKWMKHKNINNFEAKKQVDYTSILKELRASKMLNKKTKRKEASKRSSIKSDDKCCLSTDDNISHKAELGSPGRVSDTIYELKENLSPKKSFCVFEEFTASNIFQIYNIEAERKMSNIEEYGNFWKDF